MSKNKQASVRNYIEEMASNTPPYVQSIMRPLDFSPEGQAKLVAEGKKIMALASPPPPAFYVLEDQENQMSFLPPFKLPEGTYADRNGCIVVGVEPKHPNINPQQQPILTCCKCYGLSCYLTCIKENHYAKPELAILCEKCYKAINKTTCKVITSV